MKNVSGIYQIKSIDTGDTYVGSACKVRHRMHQHKCDLKQGRHGNWKLRQAYARHGWKGFEFTLLEECEGSGLRALEQTYLDKNNNYYNISTHTVPAMSEAAREQRSQKLTARSRHVGGHPVSYWAKKNKVSHATILTRLAAGWSDERAVSEPAQKIVRLVTFKGETLPLSRMARRHGIAFTTVVKRLSTGMSLDVALTTAPQKFVGSSRV